MSRYSVLTRIGAGPASVVYLVEDQDSNAKYAAKVVITSLKKYESRRCTNRDWLNFHQQALMLQQLDHPSILKLKEAYLNTNHNLIVVTEYCVGGTIANFIHGVHGNIEERIIVDWLAQICLGLRYIHGKGVIHRDIKSNNLFLTDKLRVKIGDFGSCRRIKGQELIESTAGTPTHLAPQLLQSFFREPSRGYTNKIDMWALGVTLYEMCTKRLPFQGYSLNDTMQKIKLCQYQSIPSVYSVHLTSLIDCLLSPNEHLRPSASEILDMKFLKERIANFLTEQEHSPKKKKKDHFDVSTEAVHTETQPQKTSRVCDIKMFDISQTNHNSQLNFTLENLLFSKTCIKTKSQIKTELDMTFGSRTQTPNGILINSRRRSVVTNQDIVNNEPILRIS